MSRQDGWPDRPAIMLLLCDERGQVGCDSLQHALHEFVYKGIYCGRHDAQYPRPMPMGGELGIKTGEYWAYRPGTTHPLRQALILNPGFHYDAGIRIRLVDDPAVVELWTSRAKLPCKWSQVELYLQEHPDVPRDYPPAPEPSEQPDSDAYRMAFTANELRSIIHDEITNAFGAKKISYTLREAAVATGISTTLIRAAVRANYLTANYIGTKPVFTPEELQRWVESLPDQPWRVTYR